jgi:hypothetical protein
MVLNKYCDIDGKVRIKDNYHLISEGFEKVQTDTDKLGLDIKALKNLSYTGTEHDPLVTGALVDADGEDFGPAGNQEYLQGRLLKWEEKVKPLDNGFVNTPAIAIGMNTVKHTGKTPVFPRIHFKGKRKVNYLDDPNCADPNKWGYIQCNAIVDTDNKVFGNGGFKVITTTYPSGLILQRLDALPKGKYWLYNGYIKNGNLTTGIRLRFNSLNDTGVSTEYITDTTKFNRVGIKIKPTDYDTGNGDELAVDVIGDVIGQYGYMDGLVLEEITAEEYGTGGQASQELLDAHPFFESIIFLTNPSFRNRRHNLIRNGNAEEEEKYWTPDNPSVKMSIVNGRLRVTSDAGGGEYQLVKVKPYTDYSLKVEVMAGTTEGILQVWSSLYNGTLLLQNMGTFNSGSSSELCVSLHDWAGGYCDFDSIMLVEGMDIPTQYLSCDQRETIAEGEFGDEDDVIFEEGKLDGLKYWQHKTLYGRDYSANYIGATEVGGYREIQFITLNPFVKTDNLHNLQKYDGKVLQYSLPKMIDSYGFDGNNGNIYIRIRNVDAGWTDALNPDASAVAAYMNGWEATGNNGSQYTSWKSKYDGSVPTVQSIDYVKTNVAAGYKGYRLHYIPANPEQITDFQGELWNIAPGENYISVGSGDVLGEVSIPRDNMAGAYLINSSSLGPLKYKTEAINAIYRNLVYDPLWVIQTNVDAYGNQYAYVIPTTDVDPNATYTVDYQILKTLHLEAFGLLEFSYAQDIITGVKTIAGALEENIGRTLDLTEKISVPEIFDIPYINGLISYPGRSSQYWKNTFNEIHIRAIFTKSNAADDIGNGVVPLILPVGYRPKYPISTNGKGLRTDGTTYLLAVDIDANGTVTVWLPTAGAYKMGVFEINFIGGV